MRQKTAHLRNVLGYGLVTPMRRGAGSDFNAAEGIALVRSCVKQVIGTRLGEIPWRPDFGCNLERYRHKNLTSSLQRDVGQEIQQAISAWEPRVQLSACSVGSNGNVISVRVTWSVGNSAEYSGQVLIGPITQEIVL